MTHKVPRGAGDIVPVSAELERLVGLYRVMYRARCVDEMEEELVGRGAGFFHVSGAGHEGAAVFAKHLRPEDWLHCHYRDKALLLARGLTPKSFFDSLVCNADSHSRGRQMSAHMSEPSLNVLSIVGPVGGNALQAVGVAAQLRDDPSEPIVLCSVGDGTTQEGEFLEAVAEAVRENLPVLFLIEDNQLAISTTTVGRTFYDLPTGPAKEYLGLPIHRIDGVDVSEIDPEVESLVDTVRRTRGPGLLLFRMARLSNHTNADDQRVYRSEGELKDSSASDPIAVLATQLHSKGIDASELAEVERKVRSEVEAAAEAALAVDDPPPCPEAKRRLSDALKNSEEYTGAAVDGEVEPEVDRLTMLEAMRSVLDLWLERDSKVSISGQDIEDPKGDVFGLTRGLSTAYPGRVTNAALSESTIVGSAIGRALAGGRPVACIQFADFLPMAWNQIVSELSSMHWRSDGDWQSPVILLAPCGAYRPGLGPFHAQTFESSLAHTPGIDVFMPSTAGDAAAMLNAAFESQRPTVLLYPKVCLNDPDRSTSPDVASQIVSIGKARRVLEGEDLTLVTWGSTTPLCEKVGEALRSAGVAIDLIDLRSISPWDRDMVVASVKRTRKLLCVHEDNLTCGFGSEIVAAVSERVRGGIECRRIARPDTPVPCNYANQSELLPSFKSVLTAAAEMVGVDLRWQSESRGAGSLSPIKAQGSSPADQSMAIVEWRVDVGSVIEAGDTIAEAEADKSVFDFLAPISGVVCDVLVPAGETVRVGTDLLLVEERRSDSSRREAAVETPILGQRPAAQPRPSRAVVATGPQISVALSRPYSVSGSDEWTNDDVTRVFSDMEADDIVRRTGIESRRRLSSSEGVIDLAARAALAALEGEGLKVSDLGAVICSTTTPQDISPAVACRVLEILSAEGGEDGAAEMPAWDVSAACSGYLYAITAAYDAIYAAERSGAEGSSSAVLVITAEALSTVIDHQDFDTSILFGDAATATVLRSSTPDGAGTFANGHVLVGRPFISAIGEDGSVLRVPPRGSGFIEMRGRQVFTQAIRRMSASLERACEDASLTLEDLAWIVPHQANGRIIEALASRLPLSADRVINVIANSGNTSSSSIPLGLEQSAERFDSGDLIGLCAFGAGFTFGGAVIRRA